MKIFIPFFQDMVVKPAEKPGFLRTETVVPECVHYPPDAVIFLIIIQSAVGAGSFHFQNLAGFKSENIDVVFPHFFPHFHVGPVQGSDGECAVQRKFHVSRAGGFRSGG